MEIKAFYGKCSETFASWCLWFMWTTRNCQLKLDFDKSNENVFMRRILISLIFEYYNISQKETVCV